MASKIYELAFSLGAHLESSFLKSLTGASKGLDNLKKETEETDKAFEELKETVQTIGKIGIAGLVAGIAGIATGVGKASMDAMELEGAMSQVGAATGASKEEMLELEASIKELYGENLGDNWNDLADAITQAKSVTGATGKELENTTANAIAFRDVFGEDISESIKTVDTMMKNFGITSDQAYNLLAQGAQNGLDKSGELLDSANEYAPQFAALGISANKMFDMFSTGLENGAFNLDKIGDAVKEFNIRAKDGSKTSAEAFQALGMNAKDMTSTFAKGGPEAEKAFQEVVKGISNVEDPVKQNAIAVGLFGTQVEDLEMDVLASLSNVESKFDMTKATMEEIKDVKYDSVGTAIQGIGRQFELGVLIPVGERVLPILQDFSNYISDNMPTIETWVQQAMDVAADAFSKFSDTVKWVIDNSNILIPVLSGVVAGFVAFNVINTVKTLMAAYQASTFASTLATQGFNVALRANPIGIVVTAIGGLIAAGVALYQNWDFVVAKAGELWSGIQNVFSSIGTFTSEVWTDVGETTKGAVNGIISGINAVIGGINGLSFEVPSWVPGLGGSKIGFSIPEIPYLAKGGITTGPTLAMIGEGKEQEAVLPLSKLANLINLNKSSGNDLAPPVVFSPQITIQGNADKNVIQQALNISYQEFKRFMEKYEAEKKRLRFN